MSNFFGTSLTIPSGELAGSSQPLCPSDVPLVLLPVRLETRFFTLPDASLELRVRVYPDKIQIDSHEPQLTADEQTWGVHYWRQDWLAGSARDARAVAWRQLADRFGARRAAWIARVLTPLNATERPQAPAVTPIFPDVTPAAESEAWRHAPVARLLPDRFVAVVHSNGAVALTVTGREIRKPLAVGPDPLADPPGAAEAAAIERGERLAIDPGIRWLTDFVEAESAGMALRMTIPPETLAAGLDSLLVYGVSSLDPASASAQLTDLLDAHHYTDGLAFVRPGTPTNNTDDRRADYSARDPGHERSFDIEVTSSRTLPDDNAARLGAALGIDVDRIVPTLGQIDRGFEHDDLDMRSMNTALWQVGWGYYLSNMIGAEAGLTRAAIGWARGHFLDHVRSFGPRPSLRCGRQPYGVLPVTSLDRWEPGESEPSGPEDRWLRGMLISLRDAVWRDAAGAVARIGKRQTPPDPDADLADVMRTDGVSNSYATRNVLGTHFLQHLFRFTGSSLPDSDPNQTKLLERLGLPWRPRLSHAWNDPRQAPVAVPFVLSGEVSPWKQLEPNYIEALLAERRIDPLIAAQPAPEAASLLQSLLRHALLREIAEACARLHATESGEEVSALLRDAELVDLVTGAPATLHWQRQLERTLDSAGGRSIRALIEGETEFARPELQALGQFRASLAHLAKLDTEALSQHMQGTLDLSAHRLDAWVTSFASKRLTAMRASGARGARVGAYGWLENLQPAPASSVQEIPTPPGESGSIRALANDSGFIHAPSLTHAATAALLRNAHLGVSGVPTEDGPFAIELSSRRVRAANQLLDGLRQGQPLGALLGYRIERALHETVADGLSLDRLIAPLRRLAPLVVRESVQVNAPADAIGAANVVDGLVLHRRWVAERTALLDLLIQQANLTPSESFATTRILEKLEDAVDGLTDALTAETAYQIARGNPSRLAGTLASVATGAAPPPELEVARMPRSGTSITHRVVMLAEELGPPQTPGWQPSDSRARSRAERALDAWAGRWLGDGSKIRCTIERVEASGDGPNSHVFTLGELPFTPLDVVYGVDADRAAPQPSAAVSELERWILYHAARMQSGFGPDTAIQLQHARPENLPRGEVTLSDVLEQARTIRALLCSVRGALPEDLELPERSTRGAANLDELEERVAQAEEALARAHARASALVDPAATPAETYRAALLELGAFGVSPSVPVSARGDDLTARTALDRQSRALLLQSEARLKQGQQLRERSEPTEPRARFDRLVERMRAVFGSAFVVLPQLSLESPAAAEIASALEASSQVQGGDPLAVHTWFARCARVREAVARLNACAQHAEVLSAEARLDLRVAQLPWEGRVEPWVALPIARDAELAPSKLSLVVHSARPVDPTRVLTGLLVDEWVENVPNRSETTALTFQFDGPNSVAPQCVLVAVPPVIGQAWTTDSLRRVLTETLDLAKLRAVDTDALAVPAAQHLPGVYLAFNAADHAVSTDVTPLVS